MRKDAREIVFKILYSHSFIGEIDGELFSALIDESRLSEQDKAFACRLVDTIKEHFDELTEIIGAHAVNYLVDRVYPTDKCALLIGLCEMTYFDDVPNIVAIDEALALCKKYSTEKSLAFVNGIFAKYKNSIENT